MITGEEERNFLATITAIADREYRRGVEQGLTVAATTATWLRMKQGTYSKARLAEMTEARIQQEKERAGIR